MRNFLLFVHIFAATIAIGAALVIPLIGRLNGVEPIHSQFGIVIIGKIQRLLVQPALLVLLLTGLWLVHENDFEFSDNLWLTISLALFVVLVLLDWVVQRPIQNNIVRTTDVLFSDEITPEALPEMFKWVQRSQIVGSLMGILTMAILALMVWKPT